MPDMQDKIIQVVRNTFSLTSDKSLDYLVSVPEAMAIKNLPGLLSLLMNSNTTPKELSMALENVVVGIKLKEAQTAIDEEFIKQVNAIINEPLYEKSHHTSSPR